MADAPRGRGNRRICKRLQGIGDARAGYPCLAGKMRIPEDSSGGHPSRPHPGSKGPHQSSTLMGSLIGRDRRFTGSAGSIAKGARLIEAPEYYKQEASALRSGSRQSRRTFYGAVRANYPSVGRRGHAAAVGEASTGPRRGRASPGAWRERHPDAAQRQTRPGELGSPAEQLKSLSWRSSSDRSRA